MEIRNRGEVRNIMLMQGGDEFVEATLFLEENEIEMNGGVS